MVWPFSSPAARPAVGLALQPSPMLLGTVAAWAAGLEERGAVLAPVSSVIRRPQETQR